jgi:hypothetical protein
MIMKKHFVLLAIALLTSILSMAESTFVDSGITYKITSDSTVNGIKSKETDNAWKNQLDNVLREHAKNANQKLSLIGYNYHKEISSLADLDDGLDEIFADTAYIAYQNSVDYDFEIYRIGDAKTSEYDSIRTRIDFDLFRTSIYMPLRPAVEAGHKLHLIKLKWLYNGNAVNSIAIATDEKGIFFDTIGHFVVVNRKTTITEGNCNYYTANDRLTK